LSIIFHDIDEIEMEMGISYNFINDPISILMNFHGISWDFIEMDYTLWLFNIAMENHHFE